MAKIEKFEDIKAWQKARDLVKEIYSATNKSPFNKDFSFRDQIRRASISIMCNIAEGFLRPTDKEYTYFLHIALGSSAEVQSLLYSAVDLKYINDSEFCGLFEKAEEVSKLIAGFIKYLNASRSSCRVRNQ